MMFGQLSSASLQIAVAYYEHNWRSHYNAQTQQRRRWRSQAKHLLSTRTGNTST